MHRATPPAPILATFALAISVIPSSGQAGGPLERERSDFSAWIEEAPSSPYAAVWHAPLEGPLTLGPAGPAALHGAPDATLTRDARGIALLVGESRRAVPRNRDVALGDWLIRVNGSGSVAVATVYAPSSTRPHHPGWFDHDPSVVVEAALRPPEQPGQRRMLGLDGVEVTATLAGTLEGTVRDEAFSLTTYRIPIHGSEEADLSVFVRDGTSGEETYPPGRFVALRPLGGGRYRVDFNRARNPFCAYNPIFPCPLPWPGNTLEVRIEAGELYEPAHD